MDGSCVTTLLILEIGENLAPHYILSQKEKSRVTFVSVLFNGKKLFIFHMERIGTK